MRALVQCAESRRCDSLCCTAVADLTVIVAVLQKPETFSLARMCMLDTNSKDHWCCPFELCCGDVYVAVATRIVRPESTSSGSC